MKGEVATLLAKLEDLSSRNLVEDILLMTACLPPITDDSDSARILIARLNALEQVGRWAEIAREGQPWVETLGSNSNQALLSEIHAILARSFRRLGQISRAEMHLRAAHHIAKWTLRDPIAALAHQRRLAVLFKGLGMWKQATHECQLAIEASLELDEPSAAAANRTNLAIVLLKSGNVEEAATEASKAVASLHECPAPLWRILAEMVQAKCLRLLGRRQEARELLNRLLSEIRLGVHRREEAICLEYLGDFYLSEGLLADALDSFRAAECIATAHAPRGDLVPELGHRIGECLIHLGDPNAAILACEHGLKVALETGDRYEECATQRVLAMAHRAAGNPTRAYRIADHGIALGRAYEIPYELARTLAWAGSTRLQSQQRDEHMIGRLQLWEARANFERIGLGHEAAAIDRLLGFEEPANREQPAGAGIAVLEGIEGLDRGAFRFGIVTTSPAISVAVATLQSVAPSKIPVLISGPSGTGKELLAQALHLMSDRRKQRLVPVNCAALSPGILDSELFGHERGAFTGAIAARDGLLAAADGGTLFLDEVGELSPSAQATLLRVLETGELRRVGTDEVRMIDVRVVAATNADLGEMVERGSFRRDLYYRLAGVKVAMPALVEREEDILPLFRYFLAQASAAAGKHLSLAADAEPLLRAYAWPGNVRELRSEVARLVAMSETGSVIGPDAVLPDLRVKSPTALRRDRERAAEGRDERAWILDALRAHGGNKTDAARSLEGMNRTTLLYKMERLGIRPEEYSTEDP